MRRAFLVAAAFALSLGSARAQHEHDTMDMSSGVAAATPTPSASAQRYTCTMHPEVVRSEPGACPKCGMTLVPLKSSPSPKPHEHAATSHGQHAAMSHAQHATHTADGMAMPNEPHDMHAMTMHSSINIADPMSREGSGTSWLPDSTPMYGRMWMFGDDMLMLHGAAWPRYTYVSTRRGDDRIDMPNWIMAMYSHLLNEDTQLGARLMMSLDPLTEQGRGYPLLYQTGETWHDLPLHDRQHPHDLFSELSVSASHKFSDDWSANLYFGYPGEPALGPPTFMHRLSAMDNPDAPIAHHWQDSTHVTFGVATAGVQWRSVKVEGSVFTGREPGENRYDFDRPRFDSASGRISWNPTANLALQVSHGYLHSPESSEPKVNQHRTTASAIYNMPLGQDTNWSTSLVWGQLDNSGEGKTQSFLLESDYQRQRDTFYGRLEYVEKSGHELVLAGSDEHTIFPIYSATFGYIRDLTHGTGIDVGLGGQFTISHRPDELDRDYGDELGWGAQIFLRVRPSRH